ncbi:ABC transporter ATP-binding protein [Ruminococcaceae bacterium OttesenSCG-928-A16]|nr:ABC transporter ATP-binding protein [Ruminococcaceae bacterium OttesenSCG-928-A16]
MLTVQNLSCGYGQQEVIKDVSFTVEAGQKLCVLGPNGCGKTTLLRAIAGILPSTGTILAGGLAVKTAPRKQVAKKIALMSQLTSVYFSYTVYQTVMMGRYTHIKQGLFATPSPKDKAIVLNCLAKTGTLDLQDRQITELSGGQLQRVFLARTFAQSPQVILLDEPTNHLDLKYQLELTDYVTEWAAEENRCVVGVLHDINLALSFASHILLMQNGEVVAHSPMAGFELELLSQVYGTNIKAYMQHTLKRWE